MAKGPFELSWERVSPEEPAEPPVHVVLGVRDPSLERAIIKALADHRRSSYRVIGRSLEAASLVELATSRHPEAVVVSTDLPDLTVERLGQLRRAGALVLAVCPTGATSPLDWDRLGVQVFEAALGGGALAAAVTTALGGQRGQGRLAPTGVDQESEVPGPERLGRVVALFGGKGSPGRTTIAANVAVGLAQAGENVALVDADLSGGDVAVLLAGLHPRANLFTLAHAVSGHRELTEAAVEPELQEWGLSGRLRVLVGLPKPGMAAAVSAPFVASLLEYFRTRYAYTLVDLAQPGSSGIGEVERAILGVTDLVLVVCGSEVLAAWHCQQALAVFKAQVSGMAEKLQLVVNRADRKWQAGPLDVAAALEWERAPLGVIPYDYPAVQAALRSQSPLVLSRSRAGRALRELTVASRRELAGEPEVSAPNGHRRLALPRLPGLPLGRRR